MITKFNSNFTSVTYYSHMNPQKRRTTGKYRVAEDHFCQGVKKARLHYQGREEKKRKGRGGAELFKKKNYTYLLPSGPVLHLQVV